VSVAARECEQDVERRGAERQRRTQILLGAHASLGPQPGNDAPSNARRLMMRGRSPSQSPDAGRFFGSNFMVMLRFEYIWKEYIRFGHILSSLLLM